MINFAMDLTPLIEDDQLDPEEYIDRFIRRFAEDVNGRLRNFRSSARQLRIRAWLQPCRWIPAHPVGLRPL